MPSVDCESVKYNPFGYSLEAHLSVFEIPADDPRDRQRYPLAETRLHRLAVALARILLRPLLDLQVDGEANLPPDEGLIVAANHLAEVDSLPIQLALGRPVFSMHDAAAFRMPLTDALLRSLGAFPLYRGGRDQWALLHARSLLGAGQVVAMFPEGTPSQGRGLKVARTDAARLALALGCLILPVAIEGSPQLFRGAPGRVRVHVTVCAPLRPEPGELPLALTDRLMFTLAGALPPRLRGVYAEPPRGF